MKQKIVIITSKYLHPFVEKAFEDFKEDCTVTIADYTNFDHITDIYRKYEKIFWIRISNCKRVSRN